MALKAGDFHSPESSPNPWIIDKNAVLHKSGNLGFQFPQARFKYSAE
jgi:hypothetical protein